MALAVPLSRFTSRVGGGSAFFVRQHRERVMWICPKCKESIEDQFDSCWKCAGSALREQPSGDSVLVWMYPAISLIVLFAVGSLTGLFWHSSHRGDGYFSFGGVVCGVIVSAVCVWMFFCCPLRHWFVKLLTLLLLIPALWLGVATIAVFLFHLFGHDAA